MTKLFSNLFGLLSGKGVAKVEFFNSVTALLFGTAMLLPSTNVPQGNPRTLVVAWGIGLLFAGVMKMYFLMTLSLRGRKLTAGALAFMWAAFFMRWILTAPTAPSTIFLFMFLLMSSYTFWRLEL